MIETQLQLSPLHTQCQVICPIKVYGYADLPHNTLRQGCGEDMDSAYNISMPRMSTHSEIKMGAQSLPH